MSLTPPRAASISSESLDQLEEVTSQAAWSEHDKPSARTSSANSSPNPQSLHSFQSGQVSEELEPAATLEPAHPISESPPASKPQHERPFSLQSVASSSSEQITRPSSLATTKHRPANLNLDLASNTDEGALETLHTNVDIDLDDLETVPPSTATPSASSSHQALPTARSSSPFNNNRVASPSSVSSFTDVAVSSPAHPSVQGSPSKTPALANSANGKVSSLRNRFEQSSPTYSGAPHSATTAASSGRYSPLTPPSSADKRKSVQMLQADFQRKKFEMQQAQFNLTRQNSGEPIPSVDRKQKQKETEQQPPQDQSIVSEIDDIDWDFWSLVVNDYTAVARDQRRTRFKTFDDREAADTNIDSQTIV